MSSRLLLSLACFLIAGVGNYIVLNRATATTALIALNRDVSPDEVLNQSHFHRVEVRGDAALFEDAVPFELREALLGMRVRRKVEAGRLLLKADVEYEPFIIPPKSIPPGYSSLSLRARRSAIVSSPISGDLVYLYPRGANAPEKGPLLRYGPFRYLGWMGEYTDKGKAETIWLFVAVPTSQQDRQILELRNHQRVGLPDWLSHVEIANEGPRK